MAMMKPKKNRETFRKVSGELEQVIFRIDGEKKKKLKMKLLDDGITMQDFCEQAVDEYLKGE